MRNPGEASLGVNSMKMLTVNADSKDIAGFSNELQSLVLKNKYKELMVIKDGKGTISFLMRQEGDRIKEFIMTVTGTEPVLIYIEGDMDMNQLSKLSETMNIEGFDKLEKLEKINEEK